MFEDLLSPGPKTKLEQARDGLEQVETDIKMLGRDPDSRTKMLMVQVNQRFKKAYQEVIAKLEGKPIEEGKGPDSGGDGGDNEKKELVKV